MASIERMERWLRRLTPASDSVPALPQVAGEYHKLCVDFLTHPAARDAAEHQTPPPHAPVEADDHPLSVSEASKWPKYFAILQIRAIVDADVPRTFPDIEFFHEPRRQAVLRRILCLYAASSLGGEYRQGMNDVAGMLFYAAAEAAPISTIDDDATREKQVEAWVYRCLSALMGLQAPLYGEGAASVADEMFHVHLRAIDDELYRHLVALGVDPRVFAVRWLRLLFCREFEIDAVVQLWDAIIVRIMDIGAPSIAARWRSFLCYLCSSLLHEMRGVLLVADYATVVQALMARAPSSVSPEALVGRAEHHSRQFGTIVGELLHMRDAKNQKQLT